MTPPVSPPVKEKRLDPVIEEVQMVVEEKELPQVAIEPQVIEVQEPDKVDQVAESSMKETESDL